MIRTLIVIWLVIGLILAAALGTQYRGKEREPTYIHDALEASVLWPFLFAFAVGMPKRADR